MEISDIKDAIANMDGSRRSDRWVLRTQRLVMRPYLASDFKQLYSIWRDPDVESNVWPSGYAYSLESSKRSVVKLSRQFSVDGFGQWAVLLAGTQTLIGYCGFKRTTREHVRELLYGLGSHWWGLGYATEAARAALSYGFDSCGFTCVEASALVSNVASIRVLEKCGFRFVGTELIDGHSEAVYSLSKDDYPQL